MADIYILGTAGTMPSPVRHLSSALVRHNGHSVLFDCGEGTQIAMKKLGLSFRSVDVVCITHMHADHVGGLPGFLLTMGNEGRESPVKIAVPDNGKKIIASLLSIAPDLPFSVEISEFSEGGRNALSLSDDAEICAAAAYHSVPCVAYSLQIKRAGKFNAEKAAANKVPMALWNKIRHEGQAEYNGRIFTPDDIADGERRGLKFTYITDTRPCDNFVSFAAHSDVLICEGMFAGEEKVPRAELTKHMTFSEAAKLAEASKSEKLVLVHFSPSLPEPEQFIDEAREIFPSTVCGTDGMSITVNFEKR